MAIVYTLRHEQLDDSSCYVTVFDNKDDAYCYACSGILNYINNCWNMSNPLEQLSARDINDLVINGEWESAVRHWNDCDSNANSSYAEYWTVSKHDTSQPPTRAIILLSSSFLNDSDDEEEEEVISSVAGPTKVQALEDGDPGFVAGLNGAICRGTHQEYNDYATADRRDGTYLCQQCRMFRTCFGSAGTP